MTGFCSAGVGSFTAVWPDMIISVPGTNKPNDLAPRRKNKVGGSSSLLGTGCPMEGTMPPILGWGAPILGEGAPRLG